MNNTELLDLVARLSRRYGPVYLVGGAVRDLFLGREPHDLDFTSEGFTRALAKAIADHLQAGFYPLDEERGTYRVVLDGGRTMLDFASLRGMDLRADLCARDFTVNAMALDLNRQDDWIDPLGGLADLRDKRLKACSPSSISDDPARTLRAVRLSIGLGFEIDSPTLGWVKEATPLLLQISPERIRDELMRMMDGLHSADCLSHLDDLGLSRLVLPELEALKGVDQSKPHVFPVWEHTIEVLKRLETLWEVLIDPGTVETMGDPILAAAADQIGRYHEHLASHYNDRIVISRSLRALIVFAALYHDSAKPLTRSVDLDGRIRFFGHEEKSAQLATSRARALAMSSEEAARINAIIAGHMRIHQMAQMGSKPSARAIYRFFRDTGPAGIDICILSLADTWATYCHTLTPEHWQVEVETCRILMQARWERAEQIVNPPRLLGGNEVMRALRLPPGPAIGRLLEAVREAQVDGDVKTTEEALDFIRRVAGDLV